MKKALSWTAVPVAAAALALAIPSAAFAATSLSVSPSSGLKDGQSVSVTGSGYPASTTIYVVECANLTGQAGCDITRLGTAQSDATGAINTKFTVHTGTIGNGTCDATHPCYISAGDAAQTAHGAMKISFAGASTSTGSGSTSTGSGSTSTGSGTTATPSTVNAGSGGGADRDGLPMTTIVLALVGGAAVVAGGAKLARR